jgi:hypothetical protein
MTGGTLINAGVGGVWEGGGEIVLHSGSSAINNVAGATFDLQSGGAIRRDQLSSGDTVLVFTNDGLLKKTISTDDFHFGIHNTFGAEGAVFNNNGQVVVETGRLLLGSGGTSAAGSSFSIAEGARILISGGEYSFGDGTIIEGSGILELALGTVNLAGSVTSAIGEGHLEISSALGGAVLTGSGTLEVETIRWVGGPGRVDGGTSTARTGLIIAGSDGRSMGGGTLINAGLGGVWESSGAITLAPGASGFLINNAEAVFDIQGGGGSIAPTRTIPPGRHSSSPTTACSKRPSRLATLVWVLGCPCSTTRRPSWTPVG